MLLEREGYAVVAAADADEAAARIEARLPDVVVMDLRLPKIEDGLRLISAIGARAPVIVLTGGLAQELPVAHVLRKPCRTRVLLDTIAAVLAGA
jgi:DNA-binding response OmpR family regulator